MGGQLLGQPQCSDARARRSGVFFSAVLLIAVAGVFIAPVAQAAPVPGRSADAPLIASGRPAAVGGIYRITVDWLGAGHGTLSAVLNADGTGKLKHFGNAITWTLTGTAFHMVIAGGDPATFDGVTSARGFNTKKHPGTMTNMAGDSGTWYARLV